MSGQPVLARFLGRDRPDVSGKDPRIALAAWLTSRDNVCFRENAANRIWQQFFGRGIVEPVNDVRVSNPPSNGELMRALGQHLADYKFDSRRLIRDICASRSYQLSSVPNPRNCDDERQFSHQPLQRLRADVLLDSIASVTGAPSKFNETPNG